MSRTSTQRRWTLGIALGALGGLGVALLFALVDPPPPRTSDRATPPEKRRDQARSRRRPSRPSPSTVTHAPKPPPPHAATASSSPPTSRSTLSPPSGVARRDLTLLRHRAQLLARIATLERRSRALGARLADTAGDRATRARLEIELAQLRSVIRRARRDLAHPRRERGPLSPVKLPVSPTSHPK